MLHKIGGAYLQCVNNHSCIGVRYAKLFEAAKTHVQIMRFTCCLSMAFSLTKPIWALICLRDVTRKSIVALTDHFADALVRENVTAIMTLWRHNDVRKFDAAAILFREIWCKKRDILMFKRHFQCGLG